MNVEAKSCRFNHECYLLKQFSHFVQPGVKRVETKGTFDNALAFVNSDGSVAVVLHNESAAAKLVNINAGGRKLQRTLEPDSVNTPLLKHGA